MIIATIQLSKKDTTLNIITELITKIKRAFLIHKLRRGCYRIVFTKRDDSIRIMVATLKKGYGQRKKRAANVLTVYDLDACDYRSIRIETITAFDRAEELGEYL